MKNILVAVLLCVSASVTMADEKAVRGAAKLESNRLFLAEEYGELESLADRYRSSMARTPSGLLMLPLFYRGIADAGPVEGDNNQAWDSILDKADRWIAKYPDSPTPYIAKSYILLARAWAYRGTSYAKDVSTWKMLRFKQESKRARDLLLAHRPVASRDPEFFIELLSSFLATGDHEDDYRQLLNEALGEYPNYDPLYFSAATFYDPRWSGSEVDIARFALEAVGRTSDSRGLELYARIYWSAGQRPSGGYYFLDLPADWSKMKGGIRDLVGRYPDQWNINHLAFFACLKNDAELASELLGMVKEPIIESAWYRKSNYALCKSRLSTHQRSQE